MVGYLGDGINDAPALRGADVGISVDSAVDIAKEAADVILLEKSLMLLDAGVVAGRATLCNMLKYIRMTASSNFGNVFSVLVVSAFLPFCRSCRCACWCRTFAVLWSVFSADTPAEQGLLQWAGSSWGCSRRRCVVHMIRTPRLPIVPCRASATLRVMTGAIVALGVWLPMGPLAGCFKLQALPWAFFPWLAGILIGYALPTTSMKRFYIQRFGWQWDDQREHGTLQARHLNRSRLVRIVTERMADSAPARLS